MTRSLLLVLALGLLGTASRASAACRWFGTQVECDLGGSRLSMGTQDADEPAYVQSFRPPQLQRSDGPLLDDRAAPGRPLQLDLQNIGADPGLCRVIGNEIYCY